MARAKIRTEDIVDAQVTAAKLSSAVNASLGLAETALQNVPTMTATVGGAVPTPPNNTTSFLRGDGTFAVPQGGGLDHGQVKRRTSLAF